MNVLITGITVVAVMLLIVAVLSIPVVFQYQRGALFLLERVVEVRTRGLNLIIRGTAAATSAPAAGRPSPIPNGMMEVAR